MGASDRTEKVLRELHVLFSKAPAYEGSKVNVVIDKNIVINKLRDLRECMYAMREEYELTVESREKANREVQRENEEFILSATKQAQDIYAAAIMYSDRSLEDLIDAVRDLQERMDGAYHAIEEKIKDELHQAKANQLNLKSQLEGLLDTELYLNLIDDANRRREKEKRQAAMEEPEPSPYTHIKADIRVNEELIQSIGGGEAPPPLEEKDYSDIVPEIKINSEYFEKRGIAPPTAESKAADAEGDIDIDAIGEDLIAETIASESIADEHAEEDDLGEKITEDISDEELAEISANLDAEYFGWKKEAEEELKAKEKPKIKLFGK